MVILQNFILTLCLYTYPLLNPFLPNVKVNQTDHDFTLWPNIAVAPSGITYVTYEVWIGWVPPESTHIYLNASFDGGSSFEPDRVIIQGNKHNEHPTLTVDKNERLHLIYRHSAIGADYNLYYASSTDSGQSFPLRTQVDDNPSPLGIGSEDIAVDDYGYIYVVWNDKRSGFYSHIYFSRSTDGGLTFSENIRVDTGEITKEGYQPCITLDDEGTIFLAWMQDSSIYHDIYFCKSTDNGNTFTDKVEVASFSFHLGHPDISVIGNDTILVTYVGTTDTNFLYISRSLDSGNTFPSAVRVNDSIFSFCRHPKISITQDKKIHIIWQMDFNVENADIYYDFSTDGGLTFNADIMVNDDTSDSIRQLPSLDKDSNGNIYVAWNDWRTGYDTYFARTDIEGIEESKKNVETPQDSSPCKFYLSSLNPFSQEITIGYQVFFLSYIKLDVLDLTGRTIKTLVDANKQIGYYNVVWKGDDNQKKKISSGVYFVRLVSGNFTSVKKVIFVR